MQYHPTSFLADYLLYNSGNECQTNYHVWSAISAVAVQLCRRVWVPFEYFDIYPNLFITLVGVQGNRKSTAKDIARDLVVDCFPDLLLSAAVMSREAICKLLGSEAAIRAYRDHTGTLVEHRPFAMFLNELKNFISIDPQRMVDFLTDIYDRKFFDVGTKNQGSDIIPNPCINLLACETPEWIADRMKDKLIAGGFSRRMVYVYETGERRRIPFPTIPPGGRDAWVRVAETLKRLQTYCGPFAWTPEAIDWYSNWYLRLRARSAPVISAFYQSKQVQMLKVAMGLQLADRGTLILERHSLEAAAALIDTIEPGIQEIGLSVGRNELLGATRDVFSTIRFNGGILPEKRLRALMQTNMTPQEIDTTLRHLVSTDQLVQFTKKEGDVIRIFIALPEMRDKVAQAKANQSVVVPPVGSSSALPPVPPSPVTAPGCSPSGDQPTSLDGVPLGKPGPRPVSVSLALPPSVQGTDPEGSNPVPP